MPAFAYQSGLTMEQITDAAQAIVFTPADVARAAREDGVEDLKKINGKVCLNFAKALCTEQKFGRTTDEALWFLNQALEALPA